MRERGVASVKTAIWRRISDASAGIAGINAKYIKMQTAQWKGIELEAVKAPKLSERQRPLQKYLNERGEEWHRKIWPGFTKRRKNKLSACEPAFRSSMLSPNLKRKFAHLCSNGEE